MEGLIERGKGFSRKGEIREIKKNREKGRKRKN